LPNVAESTWFRTPALRARKKCFARMKDEETLVLRLPMETKEMLLAAERRCSSRPITTADTRHFWCVWTQDHRCRTAHWVTESWESVAAKTDLRAHTGNLDEVSRIAEESRTGPAARRLLASVRPAGNAKRDGTRR
jgi:hypothetical protein